MLERPCWQCQTGNSLDQTHCVVCGADLAQPTQTTSLATKAPTSLTSRLRQSPILRSPVAKSVALGLAALAVDLGSNLLSKRQKPAAPTTALATRPAAAQRVFLRQREWQEFDEQGTLRRHVVERLIIRDE
ncbi:hypothetical protein ACP8Y2_09105 [Herpetosiphon llansteffanensis]